MTYQRPSTGSVNSQYTRRASRRTTGSTSFRPAALLLALIFPAVVFFQGEHAEKISAATQQLPNQSSPAVFNDDAAPAALLVVNSAADTNDGACATTAGGCTLREAIVAANSSAGADTIHFSLGSAPVINVGGSGLGALPVITHPVNINGGTGGAARVELRGASAGATANGLHITGGVSLISNLIINRFGGSGIRLETAGGTAVRNCVIGTNAVETPGIGNNTGILIFNSPNNTVGGEDFSFFNVISGNNQNGVQIEGAASTGNKIRGNYIGTGGYGLIDLGNGGNGVSIVNAGGNIIGGSHGSFGAGNFISGNGQNGVVISGSSSNNSVGDNLIGLNSAYEAVLPNGANGVALIGGATNNLIGGDESYHQNMIRGNAVDGVRIEGPTTSGNRIFGNSIESNRFNGVVIINAPNNVIGAAHDRSNTISLNVKNGIGITGAASTGNVIEGNMIGTTYGDTQGNGQHGIYILGAASGNVIGGEGFSAGNYLSRNAGDGIYIEAGTANKILANGFADNGGLGIDLGADGVTVNDAGDADTGPNNLQNFPVLTLAEFHSDFTSVIGTFNSAPNTQYEIEFSYGDACDASGHGEGGFPAARQTVTTDASGNALLNQNFYGGYTGKYVSATARDQAGNTSEFARCVVTVPGRAGVFRLSASNYTVGENGATATVTVTRTDGLNNDVSVNFATANGTAVAEQDYEQTSGTLHFYSGQTSQTFTVPIFEDTIDEPNETFLVKLTDPTNGATLGTPNTSTVTITDNDAGGTLQFGAAVTVSESAAAATVTVTRTGGTASGVTVNYATSNGTATAGTDYTAASGTLAFAANETSKTFTVPILEDTRDESNETVTLTLSAPTGGATLGTPNPSTLTITDNDAAPTLSIGNQAVAEGNSATTAAVLTVTLSAASGQVVTVGWATANGTAVAPGDYAAGSGTLTFSPGETTKQISVAVVGDTLVEPNETFAVNLSAATNATIAGAQGTGTINNDDAGGSLQFSAATAAVAESAGTIVLTVTRTNGAAGGISVNYSTSNETAAAGQDYTAANGTLTFAAGETSKTFSVPIIADTLDESNETFNVALSNITGGATLGAPSSTIVTITDDDAAGTLQFSSTAVSVGESAGTATMTVTRTNGAASGVAVNYATANGTATAGADYTAASGTLTFAAGETSRTFTVPILNDTIVEGGETFTVTLSSPTGGATVGTPGVVTVTITDNDVCSYTISPSGQTFAAAGGTGGMTVTAPNGCAWTATSSAAWLTISGGSPGAGNGSVNFTVAANTSAGQRTATVSVAGQTFTVNQSAPATTARAKWMDFDGDGKTDISIFRPSSGEWWINRSSNGTGYALQFGSSTDRIVPADYTGDGKTDIAFFRPSDGNWFVLRSEDNSFYSFPFGASGDVPAPGDFDGDGKADPAVFRSSTATWYVMKSTGGTIIQQFGQTGDVPVIADYDGDSKADIAIYRVASGQWWIQRSSLGMIAFQFGNSSDKPVQADYTGDGKTDVAIFRPNTGEWFVLRSENQSFYSFPFGTGGDVPIPGDYDGDGKSDGAVFRPSSSTWYAQRATGGTLIQSFGQSGDRPVPGAFVP